jgi:hypothetical protein
MIQPQREKSPDSWPRALLASVVVICFTVMIVALIVVIGS